MNLDTIYQKKYTHTLTYNSYSKVKSFRKCNCNYNLTPKLSFESLNSKS